MRGKAKWAAVLAAAAIGAGVLAPSASANIELSPPSTQYFGWSSNLFYIGVGDALVVCVATAVGNTGAASTSQMPLSVDLDACTINVAGLPLDAAVTTHVPWSVNYDSGDSSGITGDLEFPGPGTAMTVDVPGFACEIRFDAQGPMPHVTLANDTGPSVLMAITSYGLDFESDCPLIPASGDDGYLDGGMWLYGVTLT